MVVKSTAWSWQGIALYVTSMGMEACWLYIILALLNKKSAEGQLSTAGFIVFYVLAFGLNKLLRCLRWHEVWLRIISWLIWLIAMLLMVKIQLFSDLRLADTTWLMALPRAMAEMLYVFKPELLILVSSAVLWWLGRRMAYLRMNFAISVSEFQFGLVILALVFFVVSQLEVDLAVSVPVAMAFFFFALVGISIAHAQEGSSWLSGLYQGHWLVLLLLSISLILVLGMVVGLLINKDLMRLILAGLGWLWGMIERLLVWLASLLPQPEMPQEMPPAMTMPRGEATEDFKMWTMPESVRLGLTMALNVVWASLIIFALWRISSSIFGWFRRRLSMTGAEMESLPGAWKEDLLGFLKRILLKLLGIKLPVRFSRKSESVLPEIASIRQLYRRLLHWAASSGYPRNLSQTPDEYLDTLVKVMPESEGDLNLVTRYYISARYGSVLLGDSELTETRQSWDRIRQKRPKKADSRHVKE